MAPVGTNMRRLGTIEKEAFWGDYVWSHIDAYSTELSLLFFSYGQRWVSVGGRLGVWSIPQILRPQVRVC